MWGEYQAKNAIMQKYLTMVIVAMDKFQKEEILDIVKEQNLKAYLISKAFNSETRDYNKIVIH